MRTYKSSWFAVGVVVLSAAAPARADFTTVTATLDSPGTLTPSAHVEINYGDGAAPSLDYTPGW